MKALLLAALCDVSVTASGGYGIGTLRTAAASKVKAFPVVLAGKWEGDLTKSLNVVFGGVFQRHDLSFDEEGAHFSGADLLYGADLGLRLLTWPSSFLRFEGAYYQGTLTVASESKGLVNGAALRHSTLQTYATPGAYEVTFAYLGEKTDKGFNRRERLRYGGELSYLDQPLNKADTQVAVSSPKLAPRTHVVSAVDFAYTLVSLRAVVGYAF